MLNYTLAKGPVQTMASRCTLTLWHELYIVCWSRLRLEVDRVHRSDLGKVHFEAATLTIVRQSTHVGFKEHRENA